MSDKNELQPNDEELGIIAGAKIPTREEVKQMREKFKDDKIIIEALEDIRIVD